jgi:hypothetical protein
VTDHVYIEVSRFQAQRAGLDKDHRFQRVCQYYTPFLFFVKYFCIEKELNAIRCELQLIIPLNRAILLRRPLSVEPPNRQSQ